MSAVIKRPPVWLRDSIKLFEAEAPVRRSEVTSLLTAETQKHPSKTALTLDRTYDTSVRLLDLKLKEGGVQKETLTLGYDKDDLLRHTPHRVT